MLLRCSLVQVEAKANEEMLKLEIDTVHDTLSVSIKDNVDLLRDSITELDKGLTSTNEVINEKVRGMGYQQTRGQAPVRGPLITGTVCLVLTYWIFCINEQESR